VTRTLRVQALSRIAPRPLWAAVVALVTLITACGGGEYPAPTPTLPSADVLRDQTVERLLALSSVRFEIIHPGEGTDMGGGLLLTSVEGVAAFPDRAEMTAAGTITPAVVNFDIIQIADITYFSGPFGDTWRIVAPGTLPFNFVAMHESVAHAIVSAVDLIVADGGKLDGTPVVTLAGTISSEDLRGLVPGAADGRPLRVTASMRRDNGLPIRVTLEGALIGVDTESMVRQLDLSDFDAAVTIAPPL